ncbi:ENR1 protein, partial [Chunga burmeisteri]|nr:ENR1 protein [Chunga burmeisteri]
EQREKLRWCNDTQKIPFKGIDTLKSYWENPENSAIDWISPDGLVWLCGKRAYTRLPKKWKGSCTIGIIQPGFFVLPRSEEEILGTPL